MNRSSKLNIQLAYYELLKKHACIEVGRAGVLLQLLYGYSELVETRAKRKRKKRNQSSKKNATKAPNPILHEVRGLTYTQIKIIFRLSKTRFFRMFFCPLGVFGRFSSGARSR